MQDQDKNQNQDGPVVYLALLRERAAVTNKPVNGTATENVHICWWEIRADMNGLKYYN